MKIVHMIIIVTLDKRTNICDHFIAIYCHDKQMFLVDSDVVVTLSSLRNFNVD
jgi:hypothetical protein